MPILQTRAKFHDNPSLVVVTLLGKLSVQMLRNCLNGLIQLLTDDTGESHQSDEPRIDVL